MTVYNAENYLVQSLESILTQTFDDFEFIIINDGSTDSSMSILQEFQNQDRRIKLFSRDNKGYTFSLNEGLGYARGRYIARMDADDVALPERLAKQTEFLENRADCVAVGSRVMLIDSDGLPLRSFAEQTTHEEIDSGHLAGRGGTIVHPAVTIRRDAMQKVGGYREGMEPAEDLDLFLRLAEIGKVANLPDILLQYRMQPKSVGHTRRLEQRQRAELAVKEAHARRGLSFLNQLKFGPDRQASESEMHQKWAWWALGAGNLKSARKHALLAVRKQPHAKENWKVLSCVLREGWR
jgi:glycosyltransferase involved in cell wall biosynthesis